MPPSISLEASAKAYDPVLAALFASSSGPVQAPRINKQLLQPIESADQQSESEATSSDAESAASSSPALDGASAVQPQESERPHKRRRLENDDLEATYFRRLAEEEDREQQQQQQQQDQAERSHAGHTMSDTSSDEVDGNTTNQFHGDVPMHESLMTKGSPVDKSDRTAFLSNVSILAIKSKASRKVLLDHLQGVLAKPQNGEPTKIESFRFRSTPLVADAGPKRAAFTKKDFMEKTAHSTNAYVVFSSKADAELVVSELNGSVVLDRHLRIDHVAHPSPIDHRRCVFVGNLPFVDEESPEAKDQDGEAKPRRPRAKQPADAEEGLWRAFGKAGKVENVRVVRDKETRVGKGFAYIQFADVNSVEAALLLDGKRFPPMLPRTLRVTRAKRPRMPSKTDRKRPRRDFKGPTGSRNEKTGSLGGQRKPTKHNIAKLARSARLVFEGHRATNESPTGGTNKKRVVKPKTRSARRGAAFKASGGKKMRDRK